MTAHWSDVQAEAAAERGEEKLRSEPRASDARYDAKSDRLIVDLTNGATFAFPPRLVEGLAAATADQLADVQIVGAGFGLYWEKLDVDFSVAGLVNGVFGTAKWMAARAGRSPSLAKAAAARVNGAKGGRPRKAG